MSRARPMPTTWEELTMPQRHLIRTMVSQTYDVHDPHALAKVVWPERDHTTIHPRSKRYLTEWAVSQQLRYLRWYGFVEKTGPIVLTELAAKVYAERWDREIERLMRLRSYLSNTAFFSIVNDDNDVIDPDQLAPVLMGWLDQQERTDYQTHEWEKLAWRTSPIRRGVSR